MNNRTDNNHVLGEDTTQSNIEVVSVVFPQEKRRNRIIWYLALLLTMGIMLFVSLQWWLPKYSSQSQIEEVSFLYKELQKLEEESSIDTRERQLKYDKEALKNRLKRLDDIAKKIGEKGSEYQEFSHQWQQYSELLRNNLPDADVIKNIPLFEANLEERHDQFIELVEAFSQDVDYKRVFSIETVRMIEQLVVRGYKVKASLNRLLSVNLENKVEALSTLTTESNEMQEIFATLRQGSPMIGVQSLEGTLEEEQLNEIEFAFNEIAKDIELIVTNVPRILELREALTKIDSARIELDKDLQKYIVEGYYKDRKLAEKIGESALILIVVVASLMALVGLIYYILNQKITQLTYNVRNEQEQNEYHEMAILKLIDQLDVLAKGDLSIELTVTDDSTGIIADSVNIAIERIREIISSSHQLKKSVIDQLKEAQKTLNRVNELQTQGENSRKQLLLQIRVIEQRLQIMDRRIHQLNMTDRSDEDLMREHIRILSELIEENVSGLKNIGETVVGLQLEESKVDENMEGFGVNIDEISWLMARLEESLDQFVMPDVISQETELGFKVSEIREQ